MKLLGLLPACACCALIIGTVYGSDRQDDLLKPFFPELDGEQAALITDGDYSTVLEQDDFSLKVTADREISAIYIIWNDNPTPYKIIADGREIRCASGFLHDLTELDEPAKELVIEKKSGGGLCDIYLFSDKNYPDFVQKWEPCCKQADLLLISTHADDEYLMFGGTLPYYGGELDLQVQVAYLTRHYGEQPRPHELLDGLWAVGIENYPVIGIAEDIQCWTLSDALAIYDEEKLTGWTVELFRRFRPSVVVTHDKNGEYGHGAHKLCSYLVRQAAEISADENVYPWLAAQYGVWNVPKIYLHFWQENAVQMDWEQPLRYFGGLTGIEAAELGYSHHRSQHIYGYSVNYSAEWDCRQFGLYKTLVGADEKADFMDHILPLSEQTEATTEPVAEPVTEQTTEAATETAEQTSAVTYTALPIDYSGGSKGADRTWLYWAAAGGVLTIAGIILYMFTGKKKK